MSPFPQPPHPMRRHSSTSAWMRTFISAGLSCTASVSIWADDTNTPPIAPAPPAPAFITRAPVAELRDATPGPDSAAEPAASSDASTSLAVQTPAASSSVDESAPASTPAPPAPPTQAPAPAADPTAGQSQPPTTAPDPSSAPGTVGDPSNAWKNSYVDLLNLLVQRGVVTKTDSGALISKAEQAAAVSQTAEASTAPAGPTPAQPAESEDDTMQVTYVPDTVKQQIRDEVKDDVMKQARDEHWAAPNAVPDWVTRYHVTADLRIRYEGDYFPTGNDDSGVFHNFNSINTGSPFDNGVNSIAANPPTYDVNQDRNRFRLRARIGAAIDVGDGFTAGLRLGTGQDDNPVTENQTIGLANNGQGGNFSKYAIWLDRAFLRYEVGDTRDANLTATIGRFDNPFFSSTMIWANDIGFDGLALQGRYKVADGITPFFTAGGFPIFNTDLNFATTSAAKFSSEDKYLFAFQGGTDWNLAKDITLKTTAAIYYFDNIQGQVSSPFTPLFSSDSGSTDDSRPSFAQNGNTYIALRNIVPDAANDFGTIDQYQYYGLATPFDVVALDAQLDFSQFDPFHISVLGEFIKNVAFSKSAIESNGPPQEMGPVNNLSGSTFVGGDTGYDVRLQLGAPALEKLWDWNVNLTYRYVESDATVDAFTDADFGGPLTGTNLKGYILGGNLGLTPRVWTSLQFMSSDAVAGPTYKMDLIQVDLNAKF